MRVCMRVRACACALGMLTPMPCFVEREDTDRQAGRTAGACACRSHTECAPVARHTITQTVAGDVSVIFGQQEMEEVLTKHKDKLVVLFCGLTWCRPCKGVAKPYERLAAAYSESCVFLKLYGVCATGMRTSPPRPRPAMPA